MAVSLFLLASSVLCKKDSEAWSRIMQSSANDSTIISTVTKRRQHEHACSSTLRAFEGFKVRADIKMASKQSNDNVELQIAFYLCVSRYTVCSQSCPGPIGKGHFGTKKKSS